MSINLCVQDYCQNCPDFEVEVEQISTCSEYDDPYTIDTNIYCKNRNKCARLLKHISTATKDNYLFK